MPESGRREFGKWIMQQDWECIQTEDTPDYQVETLRKKMTEALDLIFPTKTVRITQKDKVYINADIKKLDRLVKREYRKHGKSERYKKLLEKYNLKLKKAAADHLEKNVRSLKESDPGKAYSTLKKMGAQPGDMLEEGSFTLLNHLEDNLTNKESVERIADHFARISQEYPSISPDNLPRDVQLKLISRCDEMNIPVLNELDVYKKIMKAKKPKAGVPGDLPKTLIQEFAPELATPLSKIYNTIVKTGKWPSDWKVEYGIPLKKVSNPKSEDELRIISLTEFNSKVFEKFVMEWLLDFVGPYIDRGQYGGQKGDSVTHYLIELLTL